MTTEMNSGSWEHQRLLSETRQRIGMLEEGINHINATKKHLKQNAIEVKAQIHTAMSRQLECLRNREVWLLSQVDVIEQAKEEVLKKQQDTLQRALGGLQNSLEFTDGEQEPTKASLNKKLSYSLDRLDQLDLKPQEIPNICFRANVGALREYIQSFGRIDAKGLPLDNVFADPETMSSSLPRAFEDYGDAEHHILYKTVEEIKYQKSKDASIYVNIPKLTRGNQDWLYSSAPNSHVSTPSHVMAERFQFPPFQADLNTWLAKHEEVSTPSIQQWLTYIKHEPEVEEDDFEMISPEHKNSVSESSDSIVMLSSSGESTVEKNTGPGADFPYFKEIHSSPASTWVIGKVEDAVVSVPYKTMPYFQQIMANTPSSQLWLCSGEPCQQGVEKVSPCKGQCSPVHQPVSLDIENLDSLMCIQESVSKYFRELTSQSDAWLTLKEAEADLDERDERDSCLPKVEDVCKANEPCLSFDRCLSEENCCQRLTERMETPPPQERERLVSSGDLQWIKQPKTTAVMDPKTVSTLFTYFKTVAQDSASWIDCNATATEDVSAMQDMFPVFNKEDSLDGWMMGSVHKAIDEFCNLPKFMEISCSSNSEWLRGSQPSSNKNSPCLTGDQFEFKYAMDNRKWLSDTTQSGPVKSPTEKGQWSQLVQQKYDMQDWLHSSNEKSADSDNANPGAEAMDRLFNNIQKLALEKNWLASGDDKVHRASSYGSLTKAESFSKDNKLLFLEDEEDSVWLLKKEKSPEKILHLEKDPVAFFPLFSDNRLGLTDWLLNAKT